MRWRNTKIIFMAVVALLAFTYKANGQSKAYKRKTSIKASTAKLPGEKLAEPIAQVKTPAQTEGSAGSEKLDIQQLEQKYWAPKDTDFSVVQNRTYTKAKRMAVSLLAGPVVNDPFNQGYTYALTGNYYFDERYGVELMLQDSNLEDSDSTEKFRTLSGGGTRPDFNRDTSFYGVGFNWVPFYAKMSFLGKKIIYFDMQVTPFIGLASYEQQSASKQPTESSLAFGLDVTQYFFFSNHWAARVNLHNRFYKADVLGYSSGTVAHSDDTTNTTLFLMGLTYFY